MRRNIAFGATLAAVFACFTVSRAEQPEQIVPANDQAQRQQTPWESNFSSVVKEPNQVADQGTGPPAELLSLLWPRFNSSFHWEPEVDGVEIRGFDASATMPIYPIFGPPPPMITGGYSFNQINAPVSFDLPTDLHEFSLGVGWIRLINEKWSARFMLSGAFASDLENNTSDAWQVRGGGFAIYRPNDQWTFAFGAVATGRDDLPVIPAVGAIWEPNARFKVDLMMPNPKVSMLLFETGSRQHWGYFGGAIAGGTWAFERANGDRDRLSYGEYQLLLGWESKKPQPPGTFRPSGRTFNAEVGYVFGRHFEFGSTSPDISVSNGLVMRTGLSF